MPPTTEAECRDWLAANATDCLVRLGVQSGQTVLDFGCGPGKFCIPAAELVGREGTVYAVDKSADALTAVAEGARQRDLTNITALNTAGGVALAAPDASCDHMLIFDVLQLIDDWEGLFAESLRALKPGGKLTIFPMHVDAARVREQAEAAGFTQDAPWRCLLNFRR